MTSQQQVRLRPVHETDIDHLAKTAADRDAIGEHNWSGEIVDPVEVRRELAEGLALDGLQSDRRGLLVVELDQGTTATPIGDVSWRTERWGPSLRSRCLAFGIALWPSFRGRGYGTDAQRQLIDHLFRTTDTHRVQSDTALDNPGERRALQKVGMVEEGIVRQAEYRDGRYHDHYLFSILRPEWEAARDL